MKWKEDAVNKVFILGDGAFIDIGNNYLLRIGSKAEVEKATPEEVNELAKIAIVNASVSGISFERRRN